MSTADSRPNVLLICTDHWPAALLGCSGHPAVQTPTLDQLAANGVRFTNAYSECPVCVPARRTLMTSLTPHSHGMLSNGAMPMPPVTTLAQAFRDAGYQAHAVGKLHVRPQRDRIGFDDVLLDEEGRGQESIGADDYELFLGDQGYPGQRFTGGMCNNEYVWRPWHLPEPLHPTNWAAQQMARQIVRKDPTRPAFWYLSFSQPHPPMTPLRDYLQMYRGKPVPEPTIGQWMQGDPKKLQQSLPTALQRELQRQLNRNRNYSPDQIADIHRAFYASCTHIDHQLRVVLGTLRQHGQLDNTILCFTADHGDMLGHHRLWAKHWMYERSANVPMILVGTAAQMQDGTVGHHRVDDRLVGLADVMPTLLELAGVPVPDHVEGRSMLGQRREHLFGVWGAGPTGEGGASTRMIHDGRFKLVYYPVGNLRQLFDLQTDPEETKDLAGDADHAERLETLSGLLAAELARHESDAQWVHDGELVGDSTIGFAEPGTNRGLSGQRGTAWPIPPITGGPR